MVMTGPMSQVGWAIACSGVTSASSARGAAAERPAAGGEHQPPHLGGPPAAQALGQRAVLGVDRHDLVGRCTAACTQRAAGDERLLVGQGQRAAGLERGQRRRQADRAGHAVEDDVARPGGELGGGVGPGQDLGHARSRRAL